MAGRIHGGVIILFFIFNIFVYFVHSSIGSLENINYLDDASVRDSQIRYKRILNESLEDFKDHKNVSIQKCCQEKHVLNEALECVLDNNQTSATFFPDEIIQEDNFSRSVNIVVAADDLQCRDQLIYLKDDEPMTYYILVDTGELVQITNGPENTLNYYSTNYCLDVLVKNFTERFHILMLCPCKGNLCIQKCCPVGELFDTVTNKCLKYLTPSNDPKIQFYDKSYQQVNSIQHLFVHRTTLNCSDQPDELINSIGDKRDILIHQGGYLMHNSTDETTFTDLDNYCVDVFSDGSNETYTNGFYCKELQNKRQARDSSAILHKCCKDGESLDKWFNCRKYKEDYVAWKPTAQFMGSKFSKFQYNNFEASDEYLIVKLKMNDYTEQNYNNTRRKIYVKDLMKNYDSSMFCIDDYQEITSDFAVIFAPCEKNLCLQKCCEPGFYFHKNRNKCVKDAQLSEQYLEISTYIELKPVNATADFFLIYSPSTCHHHQESLYKNSVGYKKLVVQTNGNIAREVEKYTEYYWTTPLGYCIDVFSNGKVGLLNGFYCNKLKKRGISDNRKVGRRMVHDAGETKKSKGSSFVPKCILLIHMLVSYCFVTLVFV